MSDSRWQRIKDLFADAIALEPGEREALLARECATDPELRHEVESLLRAHRPPVGAESDAETLSERPGMHVGPYKLLEEIGEGGFGVVFLAEQESPVRRRVALKVIKPGMDTRQIVARFEQERQALAMMDHPGIARVFDAGTTASGRPYFVMELVRGDPITIYCDRERLTTAERLRLFAEVCRAVQHAHQKGVIHRDLKPGNVLVTIVDGKPVPKVIDFGVAKATQGRLTDKTLFTAHRQIIGTPLYMSPEQAQLSGVDVDTRSDVYSLGVLLYELLVGVPPFGQEQLMQAGFAEMYRMIRELEPQKPSTRVATLGPSSTAVAAQRGVEARRLGVLLRGDLDWIVMRCLEKERARRYDTASDLAQDLERHLAGEPVEAAPPSAMYRVRKLMRRRRTAFAAGAAVVVVALAGGATTIWQAELARRADSDRAADAVAAEGRQKDLADEATRSAAEAQKARRGAEDETRKAEENAYVAAVIGAAAAQRVGEPATVRRLLDEAPAKLRNWEWGYLNAQSDTSLLTLSGHANSKMSAKFSSDGTRILTMSDDKMACVWDARSGKEISRFEGRTGASTIYSAVFSSDGTRIVTMSKPDPARPDADGTRHVWWPKPDSALSDDYPACVWDVNSSKVIVRLKGSSGYSYAAFSPDGTRVVMTNPDAPEWRARVWDANSGKDVARLEGVPSSGSAVFSPDGTRIVAGSKDAALIWDASSGKQIVNLQDSAGYYYFEFSRDGTRVTSPGTQDKPVRAWDAKSGKEIACLDVYDTSSTTLAVFSPDGTRVVTGFYDFSTDDWAAQVWDANARKEIVRLEGPAGMYSAEFSPDGKRIVMSSGGRDETVRVWDADSGKVLARLEGHNDLVQSAPSFSPDGTRILTASWDGTARVWDANPESNEFKLSEENNDDYWSPVAFSPDGTRLIAVSRNDTVTVLDALTRKDILRLRLEGHTGEFLSAAFSPDGTRIATASDDDTARVWDANTGQEIMRTEIVHSEDWAGLCSAAFSPDGKRIVTASGRDVRVVDAKSGKEIVRMEGIRSNTAENSSDGTRVFPPTGYFKSAEFSSDGTRIVMSQGFGLVDVWDANSGKAVMHLKAGTGYPSDDVSAAFSLDGTRIVTTSSEGPARVWDAISGKEILSLDARSPTVLSLAKFSPDGTRIVAAASGHTARIWDATSGKELARLQHSVDVVSVQFSPDGTRIVTASRRGTAHVWDCLPYRVRRAERTEIDEALPEAEAVVARLLHDTSDWTIASAKLRADTTLTKSVYRAALNLMSRRANASYLTCREVEARRAESKWMSRILGRESWPSESEVDTELSAEAGLPRDAQVLNRDAWRLVDPDEPPSGSEVRGLLLARRALAAGLAAEATAPREVANCRDTLARALFRLGRFGEALEEEHKALANAPESSKEEFKKLSTRLEADIATLRDESGHLREAEITSRIKALEQEAASLEQNPDVRLWLDKDH